MTTSFTPTGFSNLKMIHEGHRNVIYTALRQSDQTPVVLKALRASNPGMTEIALVYHEFEVTKDLQMPGVIKTFGMIDERNHYAIIQEDIKGISLGEHIKNQPIHDLTTFFTIAPQMVDTLRDIHKNFIIHKDIKPNNFVIEPKTLTVKLTDFNFAAKLQREVQDIVAPDKLEGTLSYMAPEQTGRMNMNIDYRSDFYALGVTFYELLTNTLPFIFSDPLELIHAHLAIPAPDASEINPAVPKMLGKIIQKLMAKDPSDRYQSAIGIRFDLEKCAKNCNELFTLGQGDVYDHLNLSQKLYGRQEEAKVILSTYEKVSHGSVEALMVCGYSGIGKTMLISELHKPMVQHKGYFISGKFDQLQRNTPYTAITQAFNDLAKLILSEPEERFATIKKYLLEELGGVAQVIIDLAPEFERILGKQPPLDELPAQQIQNRMMLCFKRFLHVVANHDHPLVLFIDDLQWIDSGSLKLIEYILTDTDLTHIFLIGAYRDNEVDDQHPLKQLFKGKNIHYLPLKALTTADFEALFTDSFTRNDVGAIAALIHHRTDGNPFFCKQLIHTLYDRTLVYFDYDTRQWDWKYDAIKELAITENVVDLMLSKLEALPIETRGILQYAACIGNRFTIDTLMVVTGKSAEEVSSALWPAMKQELIITLNLGYKRTSAMSQENLAIELSKEITYQFIHDRVQQAAYQSLSDKEKLQTHLLIARMLMEKEPEACKKERLFEVTDHYNQAHSLLEGSEKATVISLNYQAGIQAQNATAYVPMSNYLQAALALLDEQSWQDFYEITLAVHRDYAWSLFLLNKFDEAERLTKNLLNRAKTALDKTGLYRILTRLDFSKGQYDEAIKKVRELLKMLGVNFVEKPTKFDLLLTYIKIQWQLKGLHVENLDEELPPLTDPLVIAALEFFPEVTSLSGVVGIQMMTYLIFTCFSLQLQYGIDKNGALWLHYYGLMKLVLFKNYKSGFEFWKVAKKIMDKFPNKYIDCIIFLGFASWESHFFYPVNFAIAYLQRAVQEAGESGNTVMRASCTGYIALNVAAEAKSLKEIISASKISLKTYNDIKVKELADLTQLRIITLQNLAEGRFDRTEEIIVYEEAVFQCQSTLAKQGVCKYLSSYNYFLENFEQVLHYHKLSHKHKSISQFDAFSYQVRATNALAFAKCIPNATISQKLRYYKCLNDITKELQAVSEQMPHNFLHCYLLVKGAKAQLKGHYLEAIKAFTEAIDNAKKGDFYLLVALGNELAGELAMEQGLQMTAFGYIREAHYYYTLYGMGMKVNTLEKRYPECFLANTQLIQATDSKGSSSSSSTSLSLDFLSVIKASQTISGEIVPEKLFEKMLHIACENAGAQKAVFVEKQTKGDWMIVASLHTKFASHNTPLNQFNELPQTVLNASLRTKEPLIIDNAKEDSRFAPDPYIARNKPKSILCLPIVHHDSLVGLIYLENSLTAGAFTADRIAVLQTLAAQIAISLENSRHLEHTEALYKATERFVPKAFLKLLNKEHIEDVKLGDSIEAKVTVLFTDIRDYTSITENLSPQQSFELINNYLNVMGPIIRAHGGFINLYLGDAIMALFPRDADDAVKAVQEMSEALITHNIQEAKANHPTLRVGYGVNTGLAMLGTIGDQERMDANVISDTINLASRIENLNKFYETEFLLSDATLKALVNPNTFIKRIVDKVQVKGKKNAVYLYEVYLKKSLDENTQGFIEQYEEAFKAYEKGDIAVALTKFTQCQQLLPQNKSTAILIERCQTLLKNGLPKDWNGTYSLDHK